MDLVVSLSSRPGWGTHDVAVERMTIEDADHERLLGQMVSACMSAADGAEAVLEFRQAVASPLEGTLEFERSVNDRYTEYCATIITGCRDLQRREEPRYILSLVPRSAD